jgi:hypothetical protein
MRSSGDIYQILSRFPGPVTLRPSRGRWFGVFAISIAFATASLWLLIANPTSIWTLVSDRANQIVGWIGLLFFAFGTTIAAIALLPGSGALTLNEEGFEAISLFRRFSVRWRDARRFEAAKHPRISGKVVMFDHVNAPKHTSSWLNTTFMGHNACLPDTYGFSANNLANLMSEWRMRAVPRDGSC